MNKANKSYTILLVGETGVGKSSVLEFIANVLAGNDINHYNFNILDQTNERGGSNNQSQTNSTRLYELMSNNGMTVCPAFVNVIITPNLFPRSVSSTPLGWPTLTVSRKTSSTRRVLLPSLSSTSAPLLRFSSLLMGLSRVSLSVPTMHSLLYPPSFRKPWSTTFPSCSPMY